MPNWFKVEADDSLTSATCEHHKHSYETFAFNCACNLAKTRGGAWWVVEYEDCGTPECHCHARRFPLYAISVTRAGELRATA